MIDLVGVRNCAHILQETAQLEAKAYELEQSTALAAEAKAVLDSYADAEEAVDAFARDRISRLSRKVPEGGREWEILYRKYFEEEITRRKL